MMAYERSESAWDNFGKFIYQFQPKTKTLVRKLEKILKLYRQNLSLLFDHTHTETHTKTDTFIYIYFYFLFFPQAKPQKSWKAAWWM